MSALLQGLIVALVVALCLSYSVWRLLSSRARIRVLDLLARIPGLEHGPVRRLARARRGAVERRLRRLCARA